MSSLFFSRPLLARMASEMLTRGAAKVSGTFMANTFFQSSMKDPSCFRVSNRLSHIRILPPLFPHSCWLKMWSMASSTRPTPLKVSSHQLRGLNIRAPGICRARQSVDSTRDPQVCTVMTTARLDTRISSATCALTAASLSMVSTWNSDMARSSVLSPKSSPSAGSGATWPSRERSGQSRSRAYVDGWNP